MTLSMVANSAVRLNGFWMHGRGTPGTRSIMSGWPDIRMTGTPVSSAIGHQVRIEPAGQRAVQQHRVDPAGPQAFHRGGRGLRAAGVIDAIKRIDHDLGNQRIVLDDKDTLVRATLHCTLISLAARTARA